MPGPYPLGARPAELRLFAGRRPGPPWLPQPAWFGDYAVDVELLDATSCLSLYRLALQLRREHFADPAADLEWIDLPGRANALAFRRSERVCLVNCGDSEVDLPVEWGRVLLASAPIVGRTAPAACAVWLTVK